MSPLLKLEEKIDRMNNAKVIWIEENEAARKLGWKPETLRKYAKNGTIDISYTTVRGRKFKYDLRAVERELNKNAVIIHQ